MNNPIIAIQDLNVSHAETTILKNINITIPRNKVTVILGPSGCGKTTLLKCLNRLVDLYNGLTVHGRIYLDGEEILNRKNDLTHIRQKMGLLSQRPYPLPMSIFDNIAYGIKLKGNGYKKNLAEKVENYLQMVNLWDEVKYRLKSPATRLSIGQQQRLCLARGLAVEPEIILADEPTSALDPFSSARIESQFKTLKHHYTIVIVTHILRQARRLADNVIFIYLGKVIEQGSPKEVFNNPQNKITREYLCSGH